MEQYLHANSHHFLAQNLGVLNTLATRDLRVSDDNHLNEEKAHLLSVFFNNGYSRHQCIKAFLKAEKGPKAKKKTSGSNGCCPFKALEERFLCCVKSNVRLNGW